MDPPCPPHWTFAARAAYFGDRMCQFCEHRNPAGARFCNDCASPLHLKPCSQCNSVNDETATDCYNCGAAFPALFRTSDSKQVLPSAHLAPSLATPGDAVDPANVTQSLFAFPALRAYRSRLRPGPLLVAALATFLIAGTYTARYINGVTPDAIEVVLEPVAAAVPNAPAAPPAVAIALEPKPAEPETTEAFQEAAPTVDSDAPKRAGAREGPVTVPATKHASAQQRAVPERRTPAGTSQRGTPRPRAAPVGVPVAKVSKKPKPDRWQAMEVSLARCSGDLIARFVCDQRVRLQFCEGHWGKAPACASGVANDHGQ